MPSLVLGPMLRYVAPTEATIWVETDARCTVTVLGVSTPTFCVAGHHYALVVLDGLRPGASTPYEVALDREVCWPDPASDLPASTIRTPTADASRCRVVFGSCRIAAPHEPPFALELSTDHRGRGVDALYAYATRMVGLAPEEWPDLAVFLGDQVYADDSSPATRERIARRRAAGDESPAAADLPADLVGGFEETTWLYEESWSKDLERWFLSNVASVMVFDDHEMVDDWNISQRWVQRAETWSWWPDHVRDGLMAYWLYQHLGNLAPATIRAEGLLDELRTVPDGRDVLARWAQRATVTSAGVHAERFSVVRDHGRVRLVTIDARNSRVLDPDQRRIVDDEEFDWIVEQCAADVDHLMIASSLPVFVPRGLHDLQLWNERVCAGRWGRLAGRVGEWLRVKADMEDWASFAASFDRFVDLLAETGSKARPRPPATISVLSGDIHFSYTAEIHLAEHTMASKVHQLVNSPIRNSLTGPERSAMRLGRSRFASALGRVLRRAVGRRRDPVEWSIDHGPVFDNCIGELTFDGRQADLSVCRTKPYDPAADPELDEVIDVDLTRGSSAA